MAVNMDRRSIVAASLLLASSPLQAGTFWQCLSTDDATERLHSILVEYLALDTRHKSLMPAFIKRLRTLGASTEAPERFHTWLHKPEHSSELSAYVIEEFVVASNYFAWKSGEDQALTIIHPIDNA